MIKRCFLVLIIDHTVFLLNRAGTTIRELQAGILRKHRGLLLGESRPMNLRLRLASHGLDCQVVPVVDLLISLSLILILIMGTLAVGEVTCIPAILRLPLVAR